MNSLWHAVKSEQRQNGSDELMRKEGCLDPDVQHWHFNLLAARRQQLGRL
jgi:hypothetical protein